MFQTVVMEATRTLTLSVWKLSGRPTLATSLLVAHSFINGAQRNANYLSDVAHQAESAFEKIHEAALDPGRMGLGASAKVYQAHRFFSGNHDGKGGDPPAPVDNVNPGTGCVADVVVSNGTNTAAGTLAEKVAVAVEAKDSSFFFVCLASGIGSCSDLAATTNVQKITCSAARSFMWRQTSGFMLAAVRAGEINWRRQLPMR
jgi:hypothetical protein